MLVIIGRTQNISFRCFTCRHKIQGVSFLLPPPPPPPPPPCQHLQSLFSSPSSPLSLLSRSPGLISTAFAPPPFHCLRRYLLPPAPPSPAALPGAYRNIGLNKKRFMEEEANLGNGSEQQNLAMVLSFFSSTGTEFWVDLFRAVTAGIRAVVVVPTLRLMVLLCLIMSAMLLTEKLFMGAVSLYVKVFRRKPERIYKWEPMGEDAELGSSAYPMVLVQVPMYNEKGVYRLSIGAACNLLWPTDRIIIQVLDDSTDPYIKDLVLKECKKWAEKGGRNIKYETRDNRNGYKAGALKQGLKHCYTHKCEHVVIFDADFQPEPDFLLRMVPFLEHNPQIALVQARWKFVNADECLMTRIQEMSMDYHFKVEQESGSSTHAFFGFNGTAGIWRILALNEAGGWKDRTTVEDMDLAVRASLGGWKFVYVGDIKVKSELPSTFKAYRYQQHRWSCGPANLFRKMAWEIIRNKCVSIWKKFYVIYNFFFTRRIVAHFVTFFFYCVVIPTSVFFPEVNVPTWAVIYIPTTITILNAVATPSSFHLVIFWVLFENVMAMHRTKAAIIGLLDSGRVNEWVVTEKLGDTAKTKTVQVIAIKSSSHVFKSKYLLEIAIGLYLIICGLYNLAYGNDKYYVYIFSQSVTFLIMGFGYVGTFVPDAE